MLPRTFAASVNIGWTGELDVSVLLTLKAPPDFTVEVYRDDTKIGAEDGYLFLTQYIFPHQLRANK